MKPTREEIEKALATLSGQLVRLGIKTMCTPDEWRAFQTVLAAAEQQKASAPLPENVETFVAECEARLARIAPLGVVPTRQEERELKLLAIIRAQGAELADMRERLAKLEKAIRDFACEEGEDLAEVLYEDRDDKPAWSDAINAHRRRINDLRAVLVKGAGNGTTQTNKDRAP